MDIHAFLNQHGIEYIHHDHPAVFTCEEAEQLLPNGIGGADTKNLFLRDKKGRKHALVTVGPQTKVDLNTLGELIALPKPGFASPERLLKYLGITPGSVSIMGLVNDPEHQVNFYIDAELWKAESFRVHPLRNDASLVISKQGIEAFLAASGHQLNVIEVPQ